MLRVERLARPYAELRVEVAKARKTPFTVTLDAQGRMTGLAINGER